MHNSTQDKPETIKMVEQAMTVLALLCDYGEPMGVNAVAHRCSLNPSTCYRILKSLEKTGWVYQLSDNRYIPGQRISFVTEKSCFYLALCDVAKYIMDECTARHGVAMNLIVREGEKCVIVQQSLTKSIVNYIPPLGSVLPYYACGGGKILLSELPEAILEQILSTYKMEAYTPYTITDPEKFRRELERTAAEGFAIDFQESSINGSCIAVPVRSREGDIIASLSFSGLIGVPEPQALLRYIPALKEASGKITETLYKSWLSAEQESRPGPDSTMG